MNPAIIGMLTRLERGYRTLVLTNAMRPMTKHADALLALRARFGARLRMRVRWTITAASCTKKSAVATRGCRRLRGLKWLADNGFAINVAGRLRWGDPEA